MTCWEASAPAASVLSILMGAVRGETSRSTAGAGHEAVDA
eukprot:CAMPEP_0175788236 /NCGR_PEP_ID=MMETSP0097-20121207/80766_1 /TAXON_ID=311494 /ORGANISM="Alexandrium monilatum, Strain CCMP3105" /LENGTH=39 /DNA_ID= /DNA_START= /DNA_END= /DNA_ORIENTATION=